jgi:hypothetical protein
MRSLLLASAALFAAPAAAQVAPVQCGRVAVDTSVDVAALQVDADCFGNLAVQSKAQAQAALEATNAALANQKVRLDRIAWVKAHPREIPSPGPQGLPPIASEFDPKSLMIPAWGKGTIPPSMGTDPLGAFRFICGAGQLAYDDPIAYPGQPGKSHLHQFYGNTSANGNSTFESLRAKGDATCGGDGKGHALNRSAYWIPAMLDGKGNVVQPDYVTIYYKRLPDSDPRCHPETNPLALGKCLEIPNGLRFIAGSDLKGGFRQAHTPKQTPYVGASRFNCTTAQGLAIAGVTGQYFDLASVPQCPVGAQIMAIIQMPNCWDGVRLDAADHGSHMDYPYGGKCDAAHPYVIPSFLIETSYKVLPGDDQSKWSLSSDAMDPTKPRGWSLHADWFGAWDPVALDTWTKFCIDGHLSGTGGDFCNGTMMNASVPLHLQPDGSLVRSYTNPHHLVPVPPMPGM